MATANVPLLDDTLDFGEEENYANPEKLKHPVVTFFHLAFRVSALVVYILCGWFSSNFLANFLTVVLLLSMDFWTVKNITGRMMVGLRWRNYVDEEGCSHWIYESRKGNQPNKVNSSEVRIFWLGLIVVTFIWAILFIFALLTFKLQWLFLVTIALSLNCANLYGYIKCKMGPNEPNSSTSSNAANHVFRLLVKNMTTMMLRSPDTPQFGQTNII